MSTLRIAGLAIAAAMLLSSSVQAQDSVSFGYRLVRASACLICHVVESRGANGYSLSAPAFQDIARRYRADPGAADRLTKAVCSGSSPLRSDRHWNGRVAFDAACPSDLMVTVDEAPPIVEWILTLDVPRGARDDTRGSRRAK